MRTFAAPVISIIAVLGLLAPDLAQARPHRYDRRTASRHDQSCRNAERRRGNNGAVIGGLGGALAGNAIGHGGLGGTLIGAGVGAVAGHQIAKRRKGDC